ncbi:MAG: YggS family pyridoxal phosphate-dependent enzyme [Victivallales bacterium]|nr:YggS family pyridoxal phosphate-dependent enzyme [Victivallales bacterium]
MAIKEKLIAVRTRIAAAARRAGRDHAEIKLIAVSKTFPPEVNREAYAAGQRCFGENKVQDLAMKTAVLPEDIEWHMIGHLQSNKAKAAVEKAACIHTVDSVKLLRRLDRIAGESGRSPAVLLEINISGEESKFGADAEAVGELAEAVRACTNIRVCGLMTMAPFGAAEKELRYIFSSLRKLRDRLQEKYRLKLPELSMGMSDDFEIAVEEGATMVRVGSAIFGRR